MATYYVSYYWTFGDGTYSREASPVHIYRMPGAYDVNCVIRDDLGNWYISWTYTVYVYDYAYGDEEGINVSKTDRCLRFAVPQNPSQGIGWCIYDDVVDGERTYGWPYPEAVVGCNEIIDAYETRRQLVMDSRTFRIYEIGYDDNWQDEYEAGYGGTEFESEVTWRENSPPIDASAKLKHAQSHLWYKPWFKDRRNTGAYGADGFRDAFSSDLYVKVDSSPDQFAITKQVPDNGQLVFDRHVESESLQMGTICRGAPWRLVKAQQWYYQIDTAAAPEKKRMREYTQGMELTEPLLWIGRNRLQPFMDAATATVVTGTAAGRVTGPDGYARSGIAFDAAGQGPRRILTSAFVGDFTLSIWIRSSGSDVDMWSFATMAGMPNLTVFLDLSTNNEFEITFGGEVRTFTLEQTYADWVLVTIVHDNGNLIVYENAVLNNTAAVSDNVTVGPVMAIADDPCHIFDARVIPRALSAGAIDWMYRDVTEYNGNASCPVY